jgi:hypothetical protein
MGARNERQQEPQEMALHMSLKPGYRTLAIALVQHNKTIGPA